jgi:hypothetical protein
VSVGVFRVICAVMGAVGIVMIVLAATGIWPG